MDATNKMDGETMREWGKEIQMDEAVIKKIDAIWDKLFA
jgi:4-hydroxy-3-polyprenylbenzoate decarboxylase